VIIEPEGQERSHPEEPGLKWAAQRSSVIGKIITVAPGQRQVVVALCPPFTWIPFGGGVRRWAGAPFAVMEMREVLRASAGLTLRPARPEPERAGARWSP
jgi:cytochrome P450